MMINVYTLPMVWICSEAVFGMDSRFFPVFRVLLASHMCFS